MAFLDWLLGVPPKIEDDELRTRLFDAVTSGDQATLERLCDDYKNQILDAFPGWKKVPDEQRSDPNLVMRYGHALVSLARHLAEVGEPEPVQSLMGTREENPLQQWQEQLEKARELMEKMEYREAQEMLAKLVLAVQGLRGSGVDAYLPSTFGMLGECCFQLGEAERALGPVTDAAKLCEQQGDADNQVGYLMNLVEIHRWRGKPEEAAACAETIADLAKLRGHLEDAERWAQRARVIRAGEPLVRLLVVMDGRPYEVDDLPAQLSRSVQFVFERNRIALRPAMTEVQKGEQLASEAKFEAAIEAFRAAGTMDPFDPQPPYLEGLTHLHVNKPTDAVAAYERAQQLGPGWFHVGTQLWVARQMALGRLTMEDFLALREVEDGGRPPGEKAAIARDAVGRAPRFAPLWLALADQLLALERVDEAHQALRAGLGCAAEPDVTSRLRVRLALSLPDVSERRELLKAAQQPGGNLVATAMARISMRAG